MTAMFLEQWAENMEVTERPIAAAEFRGRASSVRDTIAASMAFADEVRA